MLVNKWLCLYVIETRKQDESRFLSRSIDLLLAGFKRFMFASVLEANPSAIPVNFLDESDPTFAGL